MNFTWRVKGFSIHLRRQIVSISTRTLDDLLAGRNKQPESSTRKEAALVRAVHPARKRKDQLPHRGPLQPSHVWPARAFIVVAGGSVH